MCLSFFRKALGMFAVSVMVGYIRFPVAVFMRGIASAVAVIQLIAKNTIRSGCTVVVYHKKTVLHTKHIIAYSNYVCSLAGICHSFWCVFLSIWLRDNFQNISYKYYIMLLLKCQENFSNIAKKSIIPIKHIKTNFYSNPFLLKSYFCFAFWYCFTEIYSTFLTDIWKIRETTGGKSLSFLKEVIDFWWT